ncbi:hypothetical protein C8R45DRAFT_946510 [Mycena sanguinolenta]|nr:hypothetical protein C8R45DRAFT_946510 [Mycena sanguinolenta]
MRGGAGVRPGGARRRGEDQDHVGDAERGKVVLISSAPRGGNYAHHGSKVALNIGRLLSLDLKAKPGFMRTDMTKNSWGTMRTGIRAGAIDAAVSLLPFIDSHVTLERSGEFGRRGGLGNTLSTPLVGHHRRAHAYMGYLRHAVRVHSASPSGDVLSALIIPETANNETSESR